MKRNSVMENLRKYSGIWLLAVILLIQVLALGYIGARRDGLHIDEHYSYILSNSYGADRITTAPEVWNRWMDGSEFQKFLAVEKGEQFAYGTVYANNAKDAHPPLFYFLLHTLCSLFPGVWSPWFGMGLNILLILLAQIALYGLSRKLMGNSLWAVVPVAIYGGMQVFADTALFIRMYPLMTLLTVLLAWQHYRLTVEEKKRSPIIWCGVLTFLGTFTQYYFAITAFFMAAAGCIFFIIRKNWKPLVAYAAAMLLGVLCVFVVFPAGITQITGSETNNIGKEVAANILNFSGWGAAVLSMAKQMILGMLWGVKRCLPIAGILAVITLAVLVVLRLRGKKTEQSTGNWKQILIFGVVLAAIVGCAVLVISHITGKFVYVRYLYNLFPLIALLCALALWLFAEAARLDKRVLAWGVIAVWLVSTATVAKEELCTYMFTDRAAEDAVVAQQCEDKPLVVLNNGTTHQPTALLHIFLNCDQMYMANYEEVESMDSILEQVDCSNGVVYLVLTDVSWSDGFAGDALMTQIVEQSEILGSYNRFGSCDFTTAYMALPEE